MLTDSVLYVLHHYLHNLRLDFGPFINGRLSLHSKIDFSAAFELSPRSSKSPPPHLALAESAMSGVRIFTKVLETALNALDLQLTFFLCHLD